jgi:drug/metabolite transporter (DMT)-like permease
MPDRRIALIVGTSVALLGFAANSLLCRFALERPLLDAASFTSIRLGSGALALVALRRASSRAASWSSVSRAGDFASAAALFAYALAFSISYLRIGAAAGALILFGAVQSTMIGWALIRGERPSPAEWLGLAIAITGLVVLVFPGLHAPDPTGSLLMAGAGLSWGVYSLRGRRAGAPLAATAGNFIRAFPMALGASALMAATRGFSITGRGALLAAISGAMTSGLCYSAWYSVVPRLGATRAAIVQLAVPALVAFGGVAILGETLNARIAIAGAAILGGVALAILRHRRPP